MDSTPPSISFIGIVDFSEGAEWVFLSESVTELLGYEPHELVGTPSLELVHPDEYPSVRKMHHATISQDKAAVLAYLRMRHKDPYKGYILCGVSHTVAYNVIVGCVSYASMGPKAMHNASTAQEVNVITPAARNFEFRRWGDPSPLHPTAYSDSEAETSGSGEDTEKEDASPPHNPQASPPPPRRTRKELSPKRPGEQTDYRTPSNASTSSSSLTGKDNGSQTTPPPVSSPANTTRTGTAPALDREDDAISFDNFRTQSVRTALFLDRFSSDCKIEYCSNDNFVKTTEVMGRPFFDFVIKKDEALVRSWIDAIKAWGVNERGQPSDGGFGYGKFTLYLPGRDSREREVEGQARGRHRRGSRGAPLPGEQRSERTPSSHSAAPKPSSRPRPRGRTRDEMRVDAIFSAYSDGLVVVIRHASGSKH